MKTFVSSALALAATGAIASAANDPSSDWAGLDREISNLASTVAPQGGDGFAVGGVIQPTFQWGNDRFEYDDGAGGTDDLQGFNFGVIDLWVEGSVGEFDFRVNFDLSDDKPFGVDGGGTQTPTSSQSPGAGSTARVEDAYGVWNCGEGLDLTFGQFKAPVLISAAVDPEKQMFLFRTRLGQAFDQWQEGVMLTYVYEQFGGFIAVQNGYDGKADEYKITVRVEATLNGSSAERLHIGLQEGALGAPTDTVVKFGVFWYDDGSDIDPGAGTADGGVFGFDFLATMGALGFHGEWASFDEELLTFSNRLNGLDQNRQNPFLIGQYTDDADPWSLTVSYVVVVDEVEVAVRYEDADDDLDTTVTSIGANFYRSGRNAMWQVSLSDVSSDDPVAGVDGDGTLITVGLTLGSTRSS